MPGKSQDQARVQRTERGREPSAPGATERVVPDAPSVADERLGDAARSTDEDTVDLAIEMTFPASDPPAWMSSGTRPRSDTG